MRAVSRTTRGSLRSVRLGRMWATRAPRATAALLKSSAWSVSSRSASRPMNLSRSSDWVRPAWRASRSRLALSFKAFPSSADRGSGGSALKARSKADIATALRSTGMVSKARRPATVLLDVGQGERDATRPDTRPTQTVHRLLRSDSLRTSSGADLCLAWPPTIRTPGGLHAEHSLPPRRCNARPRDRLRFIAGPPRLDVRRRPGAEPQHRRHAHAAARPPRPAAPDRPRRRRDL